MLDGIFMSREPGRERRFQLLHVRVRHRPGIDAERAARTFEKTARPLHRDNCILQCRPRRVIRNGLDLGEMSLHPLFKRRGEVLILDLLERWQMVRQRAFGFERVGDTLAHGDHLGGQTQQER